VIWATNVIAFGLWYWDLDRGGAAARAHHPFANPAFVFPEMQHTEYVPATWVPEFADYIKSQSPPLPRHSRRSQATEIPAWTAIQLVRPRANLIRGHAVRIRRTRLASTRLSARPRFCGESICPTRSPPGRG
jgi:hypothetical protein